MDCDVSLLDGMLDAGEEEDEDWGDTKWAEPSSAGHNEDSSSRKKLTEGHQVCNELKLGQEATELKKNKDAPGVVSSMLLNDNKAGMTGLDKDRINQIIFQASKGSKFYEKERMKEEQMKIRIEEQKKKIELISADQLTQGSLQADSLLEDFEQQRDLSRCIVHIDMDAFYAAVEMRDDPSLIDKPMAVGGSDMLSTSNYPARKFGVRAAMPGFIAKKLCPDLIIVSTNFDKYTSVSKDIKSVMAEYDPNFCPMSLDEAYLDLTEHLMKRQNMSNEERTVICRDSEFAFSHTHCICDLNVVAQYHDLAEYSSHSAGAHVTVQIQGSNSTQTVSEHLKGSNCAQSVSEHLKGSNCTKNVSELLKGSNSTQTESQNLKRDNFTGDTKGNNSCPDCGKPLPPFTTEIFGLTDEDAVKELRTKIEQRTRLTASAGIAPNMMLAKVCSDKNKPNGQYKIASTREAVMSFIKDLPTRKISGIGKVSEAMLNALGVHTCTDLYKQRGLLYHLYSSISFNYFMRICLGIGSTTVERDNERKSMSTERTFSEISTASELFKKLEELSLSLSEDLKGEQLKGKTISIKIKTVNFHVRTRAHTVKDYTNDYSDILQSATSLLNTEIQHFAPQPLRLRLMGVRMANLMPESLCPRKTQNTIIGAFKKLAQLKNEGEKDCVHHKNNITDQNKLKDIEENHDERKHVISDFENCLRNNKTDQNKLKDVLENHEEQKHVIGDFENCLREAVEVRTKCIDKSSVEKANHFCDDTGTAHVANEDSKASAYINDPDVSYAQCDNDEHDSVDDHGVADINILTPFGSKHTRDVYKAKTEEVLKAKASNMSVIINSCEVSPALCKTVVSESVNHVKNVSEEVVQQVPITMETSSEVDSFTPESVIDECKVELLPTSPVIVHCDTRVRVTRSGQVGTPVPGRKSRHKSGKVKGIVQYECPICGKIVVCKNLQGFNEHVDVCLESGSMGEQTSDKQLSIKQTPVKQISPYTLDKQTSDKQTSDEKTSDKHTHDKQALNKHTHDKQTSDIQTPDEQTSDKQTSDKQTLDKHTSDKQTPDEQTSDKHTSDKQTSDRQISDEQILDKQSSDKHTSEKQLGEFIEAHVEVNGKVNEHTQKIRDTVDIDSDVHDASYTDGNTVKEKIVCSSERKSAEQLVTIEDTEIIPEKQLTSDDLYIGINIDGDLRQNYIGSVNSASDAVPGCCSPGNKSDHNKLYVNHNEVNATRSYSGYDTDSSDKEICSDSIYDSPLVIPPPDDDVVDVKDTKYTVGCEDDECTENIGDIESVVAANHTLQSLQPTAEDTELIHHGSSPVLQQNDDGESNTVSYPGGSGLSNLEESDEDCSDEGGSLLVCPVCNIGQKSTNLHEFNEHVDTCLSRGAITELIKEQNKNDIHSLKRSMTTPGNTKPAKKRKTVLPDIKSKSCRSIASFFKTK